MLRKIILPISIIAIAAIFVAVGLNWESLSRKPNPEAEYRALVQEKFVISVYPEDLDRETQDKLNQKLEASKQGALAADKKIQAEGWSGLFFVKKFINEYVEAEFALQKALELNPEDYQYYAGLADLYHYYLNDKGKAVENYLKAIDPPAGVAIEFDASAKSGLYLDLAYIYEENYGDIAQAIEVLEKGLDRIPNNYDITFRLARTYKKAGDKEQALIYYKKAQEILPERAELIQREMDALIINN